MPKTIVQLTKGNCILNLLLAFFLVISAPVFSQQRINLTGVVTDAQDVPLSNVTISQNGTRTSVKTDENGHFQISARGNNIMLEATSIGYASKTVSVPAGTSVINIVLKEEAKELSSVVVTALGIVRNKRELGYSTQTVDVKNVATVRETNLGSSLIGKVAGMDIVKSSNGVTSSINVNFRGDRSFGDGSAPLTVIDGVQGGDLSSISPDDIVSMNMLKGPSAAALYGSAGQNGAIIITTKKGSSLKKLSVSLNSSAQFEKVTQLLQFQNVYAQGNNGGYIRNSEQGWGPKMTGQVVPSWSIDPADSNKTTTLVPHPETYKDFFSTGKIFTNNIAVSGGGEKIQSYFSYTNTTATGIIDNNTLMRHNFNMRVSGDLTDKLSFDTKVTYQSEKVKNAMIADENMGNVNRQIDRVPSNITLADMQHYQFYNADGALKQNYWNPYSNGGENPYWVKNNIISLSEVNTVNTVASMTYRFRNDLSLMVRNGMFTTNTNSNQSIYFDTYIIGVNGSYNVNLYKYFNTKTDFLLTYNPNIGKNLSLNAIVGGIINYSESKGLNSTAYPLANENVFTLNNAKSGGLFSNDTYSQQEKQSLYGTVDFDYKKLLILNVTGRNDWSSTLPRTAWSYFYPSVSLAAIVSDMIKMPAFVSFFKLRGARVYNGSDMGPYNTIQYIPINPGGIPYISNTHIADTLKPQRTRTTEVGAELSVLKNRIGVEFSYYNSHTTDQLVSVAVPPASGYSNRFINAGDILNKGFEFIVNATPVQKEHFSWRMNINYSKNTNKVISIAAGTPEMTMLTDFMAYQKLVEGKPFGEMYSKESITRNEQGSAIIGPDGLPVLAGTTSVDLGNSRPKWLGSINNKFTYKSFSLSFLITAKMGANMLSFTNAVVDGDGLGQRTLAGREGFVVDGVVETVDANGHASYTPNTKTVTAEQYWNILGGRNTPVAELFVVDASNIRLRELVLAYTLPPSFLGGKVFKSATVSLTGRNLFFFLNKAKTFDPELAVSSYVYSYGRESFCPPSTRIYGINLNLSF